MNPIDRRSLVGPTLSLFASTSTLVCCALPALPLAWWGGAVMAVSPRAVPVFMGLSGTNGPLFMASGGLRRASAFMQWRARNAPCPADPEQAAACNALRALSRRILIGSSSLYATGVFFAYLWPVIYL